MVDLFVYLLSPLKECKIQDILICFLHGYIHSAWQDMLGI